MGLRGDIADEGKDLQSCVGVLFRAIYKDRIGQERKGKRRISAEQKIR